MRDARTIQRRAARQCGRRDLNPHGPFGPPGPKPGASAGFRHARPAVPRITPAPVGRQAILRFLRARFTLFEAFARMAPIGTGPLAQLVVQGTLNPKVAGSSPARPTTNPAPAGPFTGPPCPAPDRA